MTLLTVNAISLRCISIVPYIQKRHTQDDDDRKIQRLTYALKDGTLYALDQARLDPCKVLAEKVDRASPALAKDRVLVPIPRSGVTSQPPDPARWPSLRLATALLAQGYGKVVAPVLRRVTAVTPASGSTTLATRTTVAQHVASMAATRPIPDGLRITLVDDVLTTGTQLVGGMLVLINAGASDDMLALTASHSLQDAADRSTNKESVVSWVEGSDHANRFSIDEFDPLG